MQARSGPKRFRNSKSIGIVSDKGAYLPLAVVVGAGKLGMAVARRLGERHRLLLADRDPAHLARGGRLASSPGP